MLRINVTTFREGVPSVMIAKYLGNFAEKPGEEFMQAGSRVRVISFLVLRYPIPMSSYQIKSTKVNSNSSKMKTYVKCHVGNFFMTSMKCWVD